MSGRWVGVDLARTLALLGMFAAHLLPDDGSGPGGVSWGFQLVAGRSAALFAVLAGVGIALAASRASVLADPWGHRRRLLVRAVLVGGIGLLLGVPDPGVAVILTYYALLFCCALPVLHWRAGPLAWLALAWGLGSPVASILLRDVLPDPTLADPSLTGLLVDPLQLLTELLVTGYYPVLTWATYLFAGMSVGRVLGARGAGRDVTRPLVLVGAASATLALGVSALLTRSGEVRGALLATTGLGADDWALLDQERRDGYFGTHPDGSWWWLGVWSPHSGSIVDLVHTTGSALLVLGCCLALVRALPSLPWPVLSGAGRATLSLYSAHVILLSTPLGDAGVLARDTSTGLLAHSLIALVLGAALVALGRRGPLEWAVHRAVAGTPVTPAPHVSS
ncbi:heparan-alpha-glucosaminide N-acetyltransferase domain-containing protein [Serinicoccus kebangsaanensis]|uniref:heparan-alpha-glucosaminide N-acetyltransferase domain-containing protein n=1 Tax=Serinicoccus kebangsaanensis TaxID=2602069 RepID=UPI00124E731F|nr:heparan-alpha-glucosaminide N-acetyltransferase domain-containing protein [Serinicoccus kebangsaanensis]